MPFLPSRLVFTKDLPANQKAVAKLRCKGYYIQRLKIKENYPLLYRDILRHSSKKRLKTISFCSIKEYKVPEDMKYYLFIMKFLRRLQQLKVQLNSKKPADDIYKEMRVMFSHFPSNLQSLKVLLAKGSTPLQITKVTRLAKKCPKCQVTSNFELFTQVDEITKLALTQTKLPRKSSLSCQDFTLYTYYLQSSENIDRSIKLISGAFDLKSLTLVGRVPEKSVNDFIIFLRKLGKLKITHLGLVLNSEVDLYQLTNSLAVFLSLQKSFKSLNFDINYSSRIYTDSFLQSILYLSSLEKLCLSVRQWDFVSLFGILASSLGNLSQLREFELNVGDKNFKAEPSVWKAFGKSLNSLKQLERLQIRFPSSCQTYYGSTFSEITNLPKLKDLLLFVGFGQNDSPQAKQFFDKLKDLNALKNLTLLLNFGNARANQAKMFEAFRNTWKDLTHLKSLILKIEKLENKVKVLPSLIESFSNAIELKLSMGKGITQIEWNEALEIFKKKKKCCIRSLKIILDIDELPKTLTTAAVEAFEEIKTLLDWKTLKILMRFSGVETLCYKSDHGVSLKAYQMYT